MAELGIDMPGARQVTLNPLFGKQREKSGSITLGKYDYQYNWALSELLNAVEEGLATVAFVELHDDVVFADSEDGDCAKFIFCQVKNTKGPAYTRQRLLSIQKGKTNSILGKLIDGASAKSFVHRVTKLRLIATAGFKFKLRDDTVSLQTIDFGHIDVVEADQIRESVEKELAADNCCVEKLSFTIATLPVNHYDQAITGVIAKLIASLNHGAGPNAHVVYVSLIDELRRKGKTTWDYDDWDELVREKGLTATEIKSLISAPSLSESIDVLIQDCELQLESWGFQPVERRRTRNDMRSYLLENLADRSLGGLRLQQVICDELSRRGLIGTDISRAQFDELVAQPVAEFGGLLPSIRHIRAAYLVEYMRSIL